jgi:chromosome segregation ATPase
VFLTNQLITPAVEQSLARIQAQQRKVSELDDQAEGLDEEKERIFNDQQRLRENMKSLKGTAEEKVLVQRYTQQLNKQEDRLEQIGKDVSSLKERKDSASGELNRMIAELSFNGSRE